MPRKSLAERVSSLETLVDRLDRDIAELKELNRDEHSTILSRLDEMANHLSTVTSQIARLEGRLQQNQMSLRTKVAIITSFISSLTAIIIAVLQALLA